MTVKLNYLDILVTNIVLHHLPMIPKKFIQVTMIHYDFSSAEMIAARFCFTGLNCRMRDDRR